MKANFFPTIPSHDLESTLECKPSPVCVCVCVCGGGGGGGGAFLIFFFLHPEYDPDLSHNHVIICPFDQVNYNKNL